jgi:hypothetical protein
MPVLSLSKGSNLSVLGDCFGKTKSASQRYVPRLSSYMDNQITLKWGSDKLSISSQPASAK